MYELYKPDLNLLSSLTAKLPKATVITISAYWCPDCKRNVARMARIADNMPEWDFEVLSRDTDVIPEEFGFIKRIPAFIVLSPVGQELGRIIENPKYSSLEEDLLKIAVGEYNA
ncbi:MAG: thioredoxin family protein [Candidatus Hodarchaeota archaeon]